MTPSERPVRVLVLSQFFRPEPVPLPGSLADELQARGHDVRVLTGWPNYPTGRLAAGWRMRVRRVSTEDGLRVRRTPLLPSHSTGAVGRVLNYLSFALSTAVHLREARRADVVYVYATPMTAAVGPLVWSKVLHTPFVLHVQDLWPESVTGSGMVGGLAGRVVETVLGPWLRATYRAASHVVAIAPTMERTLVSRGAPPTTTSVVLNWSPLDVRDVRAPEPRHEEGVDFVYAGNLGDMQDLEVVVRAFARLTDRPDATLHLAGDGVLATHLRDVAASLGAERIRFHGRLDGSQLEGLLDRCDVHVVTLKDLDIFRGTVPSKFQAALAAGRPVLTTVHGDVSALVADAELGFTARPGDEDDLERAFRAVLDTTRDERLAMGIRARAFYDENMSITAGVDALERLLQGAAGTKSHTSTSTTAEHHEVHDD